MNTNLATLRGRLRALPLLLIAAVVLRPVPPATAQTLPTPEAFLGFPVGADNKLAGWDQILEYMHMADRASDRVRTEIRG